MAIILSGLEDVKRVLNRTPERLHSEAKQAFVNATFAAHREVTNNLSGNPLESRTGILRRSLRTSVTGSTIADLKASFFSGPVDGSPVIYARIQELGGTIKAKNAYKNVPGGPYLNIPTDSNKTPAGVTRKTPRQVFQDGGYIAKFRGRNKYGVFLGGNLMYVLQKQVEIPARLGMMEASEKAIPGLLDQLRRIKL